MKIIAEIPVQLLAPFIFGIIFYWMVGYAADVVTYLTFTMYLILLTSDAAVGLGYAIGSFSKSSAMAMSVAPMLFMPLMMFGELFQNVNDVPWYFHWYVELVQFHSIWLGFKGVSVAVWGTRKWLPCDFVFCPFISGEEVLEFLSFDHNHTWMNVA
jgi:hypothetical protein